MAFTLENCDHVWTNANLATMDTDINSPYGALHNHALGVSRGKIAAIIPMTELSSSGYSGPTTDVAGGWMTPGFIDCHTHLVFGGNRATEFEQRLQGVPYETIARQGGGILSTVNSTRQASVEQLVQSARGRLHSLLSEGVTTVEIKSGYGLTPNDELKMLEAAQTLLNDQPCNRSLTLLAAHAVPPEYKERADDYIDLICQKIIPEVARRKLADAVDVFCENIGFSPAQCQRVFETARDHNLAIKAHAEQLSNQHGSELAARYQALSADHLEYLDEAGVAAMARAGTVAVLLPGAFYFLRETRLPPLDLLRQYNVPIALASDFNPGTSPLASIRLMMNMGCILFRMTPEEVLAGVTRSAAQALGQSEQLGQLKTGFQADFLLWDIDHPAELAYLFTHQPPKQRIFQGETHALNP